MRDDVPQIEVGPGSVVSFNLGFEADELMLQFVDGDTVGEPIHLSAARTTEWRVTRHGYFALFADLDGGDVSYVGEFVVSVP